MSYVAGFGAANCDLFYIDVPRLPREGEEIYSRGFDMQPGGGVPATMTILGRLGVETRLETFLGTDPFSRVVEDEFKRSGVNYHNLYTGTGFPTVISATMITAGDRTFMSYKDDTALTDDMIADVAARMAPACLVEMQLGNLPLYERIKSINPDVKFVLDTGWFDDLSIDNYLDCLTLADYYTPNRREAMKITGTSTPEAALDALAPYFAEPIVKLDKDGCLVKSNGRTILVPPMAGVVQVDSTGAGDAFLAGFLYGLYHKKPIAECVAYGNVTGGTCVQALACLTARIDEPELLAAAAPLIAAIKEGLA